MRALARLVTLWARVRPRSVAFVDDAGALTFAELDAAVSVRSRTLPPGLVVVHSRDARTVWLEVLAGLRAGRGVVLCSPTLPVQPTIADLRVRPGDVVVHTSGTTGTPKRQARRLTPGVALQGAALVAKLPVLRARSVACLAPLDRGHGFQTACLALVLGRTLIAPGRPSLPLLAATRPDLVTGVPVHLARLADEPGEVTVPRIVSGSDVLTPGLVARLRERFGARVWSCYGSTETGTVTVATPADLAAAPATIGRPVLGVRLREAGGLIAIRSPFGGPTWHRMDRGHVDAAGRWFVDGRAG